MYLEYLDLAERLNETLPHAGDNYGCIYTWVNKFDEKKHGVEICVCGKFVDVAVDCKKKEMISNVLKAYGILTKKLGVKPKALIRLRSGKEVRTI